MLRGVTVTTAVVLATMEPTLIPDVGTVDSLARYGIAQGGLAVVLLVVVWSYRRDFLNLFAQNQAQIQVLKELVEANTAAMTKLSVIVDEQKDATNRLADRLPRA